MASAADFSFVTGDLCSPQEASKMAAQEMAMSFLHIIINSIVRCGVNVGRVQDREFFNLVTVVQCSKTKQKRPPFRGESFCIIVDFTDEFSN